MAVEEVAAPEVCAFRRLSLELLMAREAGEDGPEVGTARQCTVGGCVGRAIVEAPEGDARTVELTVPCAEEDVTPLDEATLGMLSMLTEIRANQVPPAQG